MQEDLAALGVGFEASVRTTSKADHVLGPIKLGKNEGLQDGIDRFLSTEGRALLVSTTVVTCSNQACWLAMYCAAGEIVEASAYDYKECKHLKLR